MLAKLKILVIILNMCFFSLMGQQQTDTAPEAKKKSKSSVHGMDVSHFQGEIKWKKIKQNKPKIDFVFIKATEGAKNVDPFFIRNWGAAKRVGLLRGAYHYFDAKADARTQAQLFIKTVKKLEPTDLPPWLDLENSKFSDVDEVSKNNFTAGVLVWLNEVETGLGIKPLIYASPVFAANYLTDESFSDYHLAVAQWEPKAVSPNMDGAWKGKTWTFWQFSDSGKVKGIKGAVDRDRFNGSIYDLLMIAKKNSPAPVTAMKKTVPESEAFTPLKKEQPKKTQAGTDEPTMTPPIKEKPKQPAAQITLKPTNTHNNKTIDLGMHHFPRDFIHNKKNYKRGRYRVKLVSDSAETFLFQVLDKKGTLLLEELALIRPREKPVRRIGRKGYRIRKSMLKNYEYFRFMVVKAKEYVNAYFLSQKITPQKKAKPKVEVDDSSNF